MLSLDEAKAKNAAAQAAASVTPEPQLGGPADLLGQGGNNGVEDNFLSMDHNDYGTIKKNPGEVVALIKAMNSLDAMGYTIDWKKSTRMFLGNDYNTTKSTRFRALVTTNLGNGRIPRAVLKGYTQAKNTAWFKNFVLNTATKTPTRGLLLYLHFGCGTQCRCRSADAAVQMPQCRCRSADAAVQMPDASCKCRSCSADSAIKWQITATA
jgi:hypothetical protein